MNELFKISKVPMTKDTLEALKWGVLFMITGVVNNQDKLAQVLLFGMDFVGHIEKRQKKL